jgi:hypothetical protein
MYNETEGVLLMVIQCGGISSPTLSNIWNLLKISDMDEEEDT